MKQPLNYEHVKDNELEYYNFFFVCPMCNEVHFVAINKQTAENLIKNYNADHAIQELLPKESSTTRERFISGLCYDCQKMVFGED